MNPERSPRIFAPAGKAATRRPDFATRQSMDVGPNGLAVCEEPESMTLRASPICHSEACPKCFLRKNLIFPESVLAVDDASFSGMKAK